MYSRQKATARQEVVKVRNMIIDSLMKHTTRYHVDENEIKEEGPWLVGSECGEWLHICSGTMTLEGVGLEPDK